MTSLGHATTGLYFMAAGQVFFLRSLDLNITKPLRTNRWLLSLEPFGRLCAGIGYWIGERLDMYLSHSHAMSHTSHLLMAELFIVSGLIELLHMNRILIGQFWPVLSAFSWALIGTLFYWHPQDSLYLETAHAYIFFAWICLSFVRMAESMAGRFTGNIRIAHNYQPPISVVYTNPALYATFLPGLSGFLLFLSGTWMWEMMMVYIHHQDRIWDEADVVYAQYNFLKHFIIDSLALSFISFVLKRWDASLCSRPMISWCLKKLQDGNTHHQYHLGSDEFIEPESAIDYQLSSYKSPEYSRPVLSGRKEEEVNWKRIWFTCAVIILSLLALFTLATVRLNYSYAQEVA